LRGFVKAAVSEGVKLTEVKDTRTQRYAESLEKVLQKNHHDLKRAIEDFQEKCRAIAPERDSSPKMIVDIREAYKEIQARLAETKAVQQLLQGKYEQYYHRDPLRDKEFMEFGSIARNCYSKFESTLMEKLKNGLIKSQEKVPAIEQRHKGELFAWFHEKENQVMFSRNLRILYDLDYEHLPDSAMKERREVSKNSPRSLTLFTFKGDARSIDTLQSRLRVREHDLIERHSKDELRGALAHLREIDPLEVEKVFQRVKESGGFSTLKCVLLPIRSQKDLEKDINRLIENTFQTMTEGEVKTLLV
jgi:hypothetical protein